MGHFVGLLWEPLQIWQTKRNIQIQRQSLLHDWLLPYRYMLRVRARVNTSQSEGGRIDRRVMDLSSSEFGHTVEMEMLHVFYC